MIRRRHCIGLLGGTFDPPHAGHIQLARRARQDLPISAVELIPNGQPPHRRPPQLSWLKRVALCRELTADICGVRVSEDEPPGVTRWTIDTILRRNHRNNIRGNIHSNRRSYSRNCNVNEIESNNEIENNNESNDINNNKNAAQKKMGIEKNNSIILIMGADAFAQFHQWRGWRRILQCANIAVARRAQYSGQHRMSSAVRDCCRPVRCAAALAYGSGRVFFWNFRPMAISSTMLRANQKSAI